MIIYSTLTRYDSYKDSGFEWFGIVPAHWKEVRVKDMAFLERGKFTHRPRNDPQMYGGVHPFIQTGDIARALRYVTKFKQTLSDKGIEVSKKFNKGTLLITIAANIGDVAIIDFDSYLPDSIVGLKPKKGDTDYLFYVFLASRNELHKIKITSTQDNLNLERLNSVVKFLPPLKEQLAIAAYLDENVAKIDLKIELLGYKAEQYNNLKQSLIKETVVGGLDKNVAIKDSGIEYIGNIPVHWKIERGKNLFKEYPKSKIAATEGMPKGQFKFFNSSDKQSKWLDYYSMKSEGLIFSTGGSAGVNYCKEEYSYSTDCWCIYGKNSEKIHLKFYSYFFTAILNEIQQLAFKGASLEHLQKDFIKLSEIIYPHISEQVAIANFLDTKTAHIDKIISTINSQIDKLKELRKTIISNVVTGKIKVPMKDFVHE